MCRGCFNCSNFKPLFLFFYFWDRRPTGQCQAHEVVDHLASFPSSREELQTFMLTLNWCRSSICDIYIQLLWASPSLQPFFLSKIWGLENIFSALSYAEDKTKQLVYMVWMIIVPCMFCIRGHLYRVFKPKITQK